MTKYRTSTASGVWHATHPYASQLTRITQIQKWQQKVADIQPLLTACARNCQKQAAEHLTDCSQLSFSSTMQS